MMEGSPRFEGPKPDYEGEIARMVDEGGPVLPEESTVAADQVRPEGARTIPIPRPETYPQPEQPSQGQ